MTDTKKGFTLIELLGVLVLISIIALISYIVIDKLLKDSKQKMYEKQLRTIELATQNWMSDHLYMLPDDETTITLMTLKMGGYVDENIADPVSGKCFSNFVTVKIKNNEENNKYIYQIDESSISLGSNCSIYEEEIQLTITQKDQFIYTLDETKLVIISNYENLDKSKIKLNSDYEGTSATVSEMSISEPVKTDNGMFETTVTINSGTVDETLQIVLEEGVVVTENGIKNNKLKSELITVKKPTLNVWMDNTPSEWPSGNALDLNVYGNFTGVDTSKIHLCIDTVTSDNILSCSTPRESTMTIGNEEKIDSSYRVPLTIIPTSSEDNLWVQLEEGALTKYGVKSEATNSELIQIKQEENVTLIYCNNICSTSSSTCSIDQLATDEGVACEGNIAAQNNFIYSFHILSDNGETISLLFDQAQDFFGKTPLAITTVDGTTYLDYTYILNKLKEFDEIIQLPPFSYKLCNRGEEACKSDFMNVLNVESRLPSVQEITSITYPGLALPNWLKAEKGKEYWTSSYASYDTGEGQLASCGYHTSCTIMSSLVGEEEVVQEYNYNNFSIRPVIEISKTMVQYDPNM